MKSLAAALVLLTALAFPALGQDPPAPPLAIPKPPGATVTTELNAGPDEIVQLVMGSLALMGPGGASLDPAQLKQALGMLERVQFAEMKVKGNLSAADTLALFEKEVAGRRVIYDAPSAPGTSFLLLATQDGGYFGAIIESGKSGEGRIRAARLIGFPDIANVVRLAAPLLLGLVGIASEAPAQQIRPDK